MRVICVLVPVHNAAQSRTNNIKRGILQQSGVGLIGVAHSATWNWLELYDLLKLCQK